jgi:hypothetical protein
MSDSRLAARKKTGHGNPGDVSKQRHLRSWLTDVSILCMAKMAKSFTGTDARVAGAIAPFNTSVRLALTGFITESGT